MLRKHPFINPMMSVKYSTKALSVEHLISASRDALQPCYLNYLHFVPSGIIIENYMVPHNPEKKGSTSDRISQSMCPVKSEPSNYQIMHG